MQNWVTEVKFFNLFLSESVEAEIIRLRESGYEETAFQVSANVKFKMALFFMVLLPSAFLVFINAFTKYKRSELPEFDGSEYQKLKKLKDNVLMIFITFPLFIYLLYPTFDLSNISCMAEKEACTLPYMFHGIIYFVIFMILAPFALSYINLSFLMKRNACKPL